MGRLLLEDAEATPLKYIMPNSGLFGLKISIKKKI